jgi:hypothetical protein
VPRVVDSTAAVKPSPEDLRKLLVAAIGKQHYLRRETGPKALMFAVLEEAVRSYFSRNVRVREEAERWFNLRRARTLFSFTVVCETLDLEPDELSNRLFQLRMQTQSHRGVTPNVGAWGGSANRPAQQKSRDQPSEPMPPDVTVPLRAQHR